MKKRIITIAAALMIAAAPAMAQVFINDDDANNRADSDEAGMFVNNPGIYDSGEDWFVPVGESLFVLAGLAGAYLIGKRKNEK